MGSTRKSARGLRAALGALAALALGLGGAVAVAAPPAQAAGDIDLRAQLIAPATAPSGSEFSYTALVGNSGIDPADGTTFTLTFAPGTTGISASCIEAIAGASCDPATFVIDPGSATVAPTLTGTIPVLPGRTGDEEPVIALAVSGSFPNATSAAAQLTAQGPAGTTEADPASNTSSQTTILDHTFGLSVSVSQDLDTILSGQTRTYTVVYSNEGPGTAREFLVSLDLSVFQSEVTTAATTCQASGGAVCPEWASEGSSHNIPGSQFSPFDFPSGSNPRLTLAPGQNIVLTVTIQTVLAGCAPEGTSIMNAIASLEVPSGGANTGTATTGPTPLVGAIDYLKCPQVSLSVEQTVDDLELVSGDTRNVRITYANDGPNAVYDMPILALVTLDVASTTRFVFSCESTNGATCPSWAQGEYVLQHVAGTYRVFTITSEPRPMLDLGVGQSITIAVEMTTTLDRCAIAGAAELLHHASFTTPNEFDNIGTAPNPVRSEGTISYTPCPKASVSVEKTQDVSSVPSGGTRTAHVVYENGGPSTVTDLAISDQLSVDQAHTTVVDLSCEATPASACPAWATGSHTVTAGSGMTDLFALAAGRPPTLTLDPGARVDFTIELATTLETCSVAGTASSTNTAAFTPPYFIDNSAGGPDSATVTAEITCVDVGTTTAIELTDSGADAPITVTSTIGNSAGTAVDVPVTIALPQGGFVFDPEDGATIECTPIGIAACPADLAYDPILHAVTGTIASLPAGGQLSIAVLGRTGLVPQAGGQSFAVVTTAPALGDVKPDDGNRSSATFAYANTRTALTVTQRLSEPAPADTTFTGVLDCTLADAEFELTIPAGETEASVVASDEIWRHEDCTVTMSEPAAGPGFAWTGWITPQEQSIDDLGDPDALVFEIGLEPVDIPPEAAVDVVAALSPVLMAPGSAWTATSSFSNGGPSPVTGLAVFDEVGVHAAHASTFELSCVSSTGTGCPAWAQGIYTIDRTATDAPAFSPIAMAAGPDATIDLAPGQRIDIIATFATELTGCTPFGNTMITLASRFTMPDEIENIGGSSSASSFPSTIIGGEACPETSIVLTHTQAESAVFAGEPHEATITYRNDGPIAMTDLPVSATMQVGTGHTTTVEILCEAAPGSTCPEWATGSRTVTGDGESLDLFALFADDAAQASLEVGDELVFTVRTTTMPEACPAGGLLPVPRTAGMTVPPDVFNVGGPSQLELASQLMCVDVSTTTAVEQASTEPGSPVTVRATVTNDSGFATRVPVVIALPEGGIEFDESDLAGIECTVTVGATCPTDLAYDPELHAITGTIGLLPPSQSVTLAIPGATGLVPPAEGEEHLVVTTASPVGDIGADDENRSSAPIAVVNSRTALTVTQRISEPVPADTTFTGVLDCTLAEAEFELTIPAGETEASIVASDEIWRHEDCRVAVTAPDAGPGFAWTDWITPEEQEIADLGDPAALVFELGVALDEEPEEPTDPEDPEDPPVVPPVTPPVAPGDPGGTEAPGCAPGGGAGTGADCTPSAGLTATGQDAGTSRAVGIAAIALILLGTALALAGLEIKRRRRLAGGASSGGGGASSGGGDPASGSDPGSDPASGSDPGSGSDPATATP